jgi:SAM-dependent methyltransferase
VTVERDRRSPPGGSPDPEAPRRQRPPADDPPGEERSGENLSGDEPDEDPSADRVSIEDFLGDPTRDLSAWRRLWRRDVPFPIRSHRGLLGSVLVAFKRLFRPLVSVPQNDLWERQRVFNVILLEHLQALARRRHEDRVSHLEGFLDRGIQEVMAHNDALFARVDQKVDRRSREVRDLAAGLGAALALVEGPRVEGTPPEEAGSEAGEKSAVETLARAREEHAYLELEQRHRGTETEIRERLERYLPYLESAAASTERPVLDLGCGRGEALRLLGEHGLAARGVDGSARMVERCREQGLEAETGDLFEALAARSEGPLGGIVSFHVIEHLPAPELDRLVRLAHRALAPGGVLILETPNPLSLVAGSRNFWLDPTHRRPVHPESLRLLYELAGFSSIEVLELRPFPESERLPQIDLTDLPEDLHLLADQINRLRDRLDDLLYGAQDFAVVGHV